MTKVSSNLSNRLAYFQTRSTRPFRSAKPSGGEVNNAVSLGIQGTSNNSNTVGQMSLSVDPSYSQAQMQQISDKLDEPILALRR